MGKRPLAVGVANVRVVWVIGANVVRGRFNLVRFKGNRHPYCTVLIPVNDSVIAVIFQNLLYHLVVRRVTLAQVKLTAVFGGEVHHHCANAVDVKPVFCLIRIF